MICLQDWKAFEYFKFICMKKNFTSIFPMQFTSYLQTHSLKMLLFVFISQFTYSQGWKALDPAYPEPNLGCSSIQVLDNNTIWAAHAHYSVNDSLYGFFVDSLCRVANSTDAGKTWRTSFVPMGNPAFVANIFALDQNTAWISGLDGGGGGSKIFQTKDGGLSWNLVSSIPWDPVSSWVDFIYFWDTSRGITMGDPRDGEFEIYLTNDGGTTWSRVNSAQIPDPLPGEFGYNNDYDVVRNTIWFGTNKGRVFRSTDFGQNWTVSETGLTDGAFDFGDHLHGIFYYTDFTNYRTEMKLSKDGGLSWTPLDNLPENGYFRMNTLEYIPGNNAIIMTVTNQSILKGPFRTFVSFDDGAHWILWDEGQNIGWMSFTDSKNGWGGQPQMVSGPSTLFKYIGRPVEAPQSNIWAAHNPDFPSPNLGCSAIDVVSKDVIWSAHAHYSVNDSLYGFFVDSLARVAVSKDGGQSWSNSFIPMGNPAFIANVTAMDANTAWISGLDGGGGGSKILKTEDGGKTWKHQVSAAWDPVSSWVDFVHFWSPAKGIAMGDPRDGEFEIYLTANGGQFWTRVTGDKIPDPLPGEFGYNNDYDVVGNTIWFGTNKGRVFRSFNSGAQWEVFDSGLPDGAFDFGDQLNGIFYYTDFTNFTTRMMQSKDGGASWNELHNLPENGKFRMNTLEYIPGSNVVIMTTTNESLLNGIFRTWVSYNDGQEWKQIDEGSNVGWMNFINPQIGWGGQPQMLNGPSYLFKYNGSPLTGLFQQSKRPFHVDIFPNPFIDYFMLDIELEGDFVILVNDLQGKLIHKQTLHNSGKNNFKLNFPELKPGQYQLTVSHNQGFMSTRIVKQL